MNELNEALNRRMRQRSLVPLLAKHPWFNYALIAVGVALMVVGFVRLDALGDWVETEATITSARFVQRDRRKTPGDDSVFHYQAEYRVNGETYVNNFGRGVNVEQSGSVGATIPIHYNPNNPGEAYTTLNTDKTLIGFLAFGGSIALIGSILAVVTHVHIRRSKVDTALLGSRANQAPQPLNAEGNADNVGGGKMTGGF